MAQQDTNTVVVTGRLTRDAESRAVGNDNTVTDLRLAFTTREKRSGEWEDHSNYVDVTLWGREGLLPYLRKGVQITVTGRLRFEEWEKDGQRRNTLKVVAQDVQLMNSRGENTQQDPAPRGNDIPAPQADTLPGTAGGGSRRTTDPDSIEIPFAASWA